MIRLKLMVSLLFTLGIYGQKLAPLQIGNVWVFDQGTHRERNSIISDTVINNQKYYISNYLPLTLNGLTETDSLYVLNRITSPVFNYDFPYFKKDAHLNDSIVFNKQNMVYRRIITSIADGIVFGKNVKVKTMSIDNGGLTGGYEWWTEEFGLLGGVEHTGGPYSNLVGCVIDGVVYGDTSMTVGVNEEPYTTLNFQLYQNYPNPFNPSTKITFEITKTEFVELKVFDILGNEVANLLNEEKSPGKYSLNFDGSNLSSGMYLLRLQSGNNVQSKKMILMK